MGARTATLARTEPPRLATAVALEREPDVLLVGPRASTYALPLQAVGCTVDCVSDPGRARAFLRNGRYRAVVIDPDIGSWDAVSFTVDVKLGDGAIAAIARVPFVILPLARDHDALIYVGYEEFTVRSIEAVRLEHVVLELLSGGSR